MVIYEWNLFRVKQKLICDKIYISFFTGNEKRKKGQNDETEIEEYSN